MRRQTVTALALAAFTTMSAPLAASGQSFPGVVTTAPVSAAPALGAAILGVLGLALLAVGALALRQPASWQRSAAPLVVMIAMAGIAYAIESIPDPTISGADCNRVSEHPFEQHNNKALLKNACPNSIVIKEIQNFDDCFSYIEGTCAVDQVLPPDASCTLPEWNCT